MLRSAGASISSTGTVDGTLDSAWGVGCELALLSRYTSMKSMVFRVSDQNLLFKMFALGFVRLQ